MLGVIEKAKQAFCFSELFSQTLGERACLSIAGLKLDALSMEELIGLSETVTQLF